MIFTGTVSHLSQKGLGVVKNNLDGLSYFVYGAWPGDSGEFEIVDKPLNNKKFAYAKLIRLTQPSSQRQIPPCPHTNPAENACTGCPWMIADYTSQLTHKRNRFVYALQRVGFDAAALNIGAVHPAPQQYGYRNRCQLKTDGVTLGFVSETSHRIAPINDCLVLNDACRDLLKAVQQQLPNTAWRSSDPLQWHTIDLDDAMQADEIHIDRKRPFQQGNTRQNEWMQAWLRRKCTDLDKPGKVVELFCGSGNFTPIIAASDCASVLAFEADTDAVQLLKDKNLAKTTVQNADLFDAFTWKKLRPLICDANTLVLDPPRAGLKKHQGFFDSFQALNTIIYISCNPETFARDTWFFNQHGFSFEEIQLIDLFPHTPHVEILSVLKKNAAS